MDFRKELAKELGLGAIAENTMLDDYVKACEAIAVRHHESEVKKFRLGAVMLSLPERKAELLQTLKKLQEDNKITDEEFQKGYYNGFEDGCNAMIEFLSGNGA